MSTHAIDEIVGGRLQSELAELCDTTQAAMSLILRGKRNPSAFLARKLAGVLNVPLDQLVSALEEAATK